MLSVAGLELARRGRAILSGLSFQLAEGSLTAIIGPNGAGKSTLLGALAGDLAPGAGRIAYGRCSLASLTLAERARLRAMLPQRPQIAFGFPVRSVVAMGLHPHGLSAQVEPGRGIVEGALDALDLVLLADRPAFALSGGEEQRAHLARALAQVDAALAVGSRPLLLLDEPTTGLDYRHQYALARLLRGLAGRGVTIVASLHDIALARDLADRVLLLAEGRLRVNGAPAHVLTPAHLARWFGLEEPAARRLAA
ncbi:MAG: ATP-binding cassette domain-containing protein [Thermaurantiacus sp.]